MSITSAQESPDRYVVVARRYRPQQFAELIGQEPLVQTLRNAIAANRVGHAYLFTGSRGVGKTSAARIFAKALNCQQGSTATPCDTCESCEAVATGDDVDVLEIDGASNRGIDEIRQLRANVGIRPSRSRHKIYIIDEVHMLSRDAFNALLKTLEEPPEHVKFIFCTTDADKVPVTVLSRCQRFDLAPIQIAAIATRLVEIVQEEGATAEPEALQLLARRAEGSLRDSQSLLEQALASLEGTITVDRIHRLLGTAPQEHVTNVMEALLEGNAKQAIESVDTAIQRGIDVGQFCEQLLTMLRDTMVVGVGCGSEFLQSLHAEQHGTLQAWSDRWGIPAIVSALQILEQTLARMRLSVQRRALLEVALVQIANLDSLTEVADLARAAAAQADNVSAARSSQRVTPVSSERKKKPNKLEAAPYDPGADSVQALAPLSTSPVSPSEVVVPTAHNAVALWQKVVNTVEGLAGTLASKYQTVTFQEPDRLIVTFDSSFQRDQCERPARRQALEATLAQLTASAISLDFRSADAEPTESPQAAKAAAREREAECYRHPLVKEAVELFDAEVTGISSKE